MTSVEQYVKASIRKNTERSYKSAIEHYEISWGGLLPATPDTVARYLAAYAGKLVLPTLKHRLAAISQWHLEYGFADPTKSKHVRQVMKGIAELHPHREKRAAPVQLIQLEKLETYWNSQIQASPPEASLAPLLRDRALILLGFWRAFRSDELCRLRIENIIVHADNLGMEFHLARTKTSNQTSIQSVHTHKCPALKRLCPVAAYSDWVNLLDDRSGPLFRGIDRWGHIAPTALHTNSVIPIIRNAFTRVGLCADAISSHSLRRGFATWANANGWDVKSLMDYVGWRDMKSALKYIEPHDPYFRDKIDKGLGP